MPDIGIPDEEFLRGDVPMTKQEVLILTSRRRASIQRISSTTSARGRALSPSRQRARLSRGMFTRWSAKRRP